MAADRTRIGKILATTACGGLLVVASLLSVGCSHLNGEIRVRGRIVDAETGEPLEGVELRLQRSAFSLFDDDFARTSVETVRIDDRFEIACRRCRHLGLSFVKPGYHWKQLQFGLDPADDGATRRVEEDVVVALLREGELVHLETYQGILKHGADMRNVLPVELGPIVHGLAPEHVVERAAKQGHPGALGHVALEVEVDDAGRIVEIEHEGWPRPRTAVLDFSSARGGAIAYQPRAKNVDEIALEMREAPSDGYQPTLSLDPTWNETRYFYVKIGDRFGRGQVTPVIIERTSEGRRASVSVRLSLSPDPGSRNLETR